MQKLNSMKVRLKKILDFILCKVLQRHLKVYTMRCMLPACNLSEPFGRDTVQYCERCKKRFNKEQPSS